VTLERIDSDRPSIDIAIEEYGPESISVQYRNYLLDVWASISDKKTAYASTTELNNRFHQNFRTIDTIEKPSNEILIPIIIDILTSAKEENYGFNIPLTSFKERGTQTARQYLNYLLNITRISAKEAGLRYRIDLTRSDDSLSSPVQENISTLQAFFHDGFQSDIEPYPIIPDKYQYKSPFFLEYSEWLQMQNRFYPENFYNIQDSVNFKEIGYIGYASTRKDDDKYKITDGEKLFADLDVDLKNAHQDYNIGLYSRALDEYQGALKKIEYLLSTAPSVSSSLSVGKFIAGAVSSSYPKCILSLESPEGSHIASHALEYFSDRQKVPIRNVVDLNEFTKHDTFGGAWQIEYNHYDDRPMERSQYALIYLVACVMPTVLGDTALALGDFPKALYYYSRLLDPKILLGMASINDRFYKLGVSGNPDLHLQGDIPYTFSIHGFDSELSRVEDEDDVPRENKITVSPKLLEKIIRPMERTFFLLRIGNAMLEWADLLYRTEGEANIARARELYKGVLFLHGISPPIDPDWNLPLELSVVENIEVSYISDYENPAITSQKARAKKGYNQIELGLNYFGFNADMVPILRYRILKDTADRFASLAKSLQTDYLNYMEKLEEATKESILTSNLLKKAILLAKIGKEQEQTAKYYVSQAKEKVEEVKNAIKAKEDEISDHESFFSQFKDYVSGFKGALDSIPGEGKDYAASGVTSGGEGGVAAGAGMLGAYAIFVYCSYVSMSGMADAANKRRSDLETLKEKVLPAANEFVILKEREVNIAQLNQEISRADQELAHDLVLFQSNRFLNRVFWSNLAKLAKRIFHFYLDTGAKFGWLAERALSYDQDRLLDIIRLDYFPLSLNGVTGPDLLQSDLSQLEASRLDGLKSHVQIKQTFSLMRNFPLSFGQMKKTGECLFKTEESLFRQAYPGTFGYQIKNVTVTIEYSIPSIPAKGMLRNYGTSLKSRSNGEMHISTRFDEGLPISEFRFTNDITIFGMPNETTLPFEGIGIETFWTLDFPLAANPYGINHVTDIMLTFDLTAQYSAELYEKERLSAPDSIQRLIFISSRKYQSKVIDEFRGSASSVDLIFNIQSIGLPKNETNRKIKNIVIFVSGTKVPDKIIASVNSNKPTINCSITFEKGIASSNVGPTIDDPSSSTPHPLNAFVNIQAEQIFTLAIKKSENPGTNFSEVTDVILGIEYNAQISK
jgi:gas vesicle protein